MKTHEEIKKELSQVNLALAESCYVSSSKEECDLLRKRARDLREELRFLDFNLVATDYEIDVYECPQEKYVKYYRIAPHGISKEIGFIKISYGIAAKPKIGNIGYEMQDDYRGNNYTIRALEMLVDEMLDKGLEKPTLAAYPSNLPSVRIIEKFGGEIIHQAQNRFDWNIYKVDLSKKRQSYIKKK